MLPTQKWFDRRFSFELPVWMFPNLVERLRGTPARVEEAVRGLDRDQLVHQEGGVWSIQVNVGHLADLEPLWSGRLDDVLEGRPRMRPADLENRQTEEAGHNDNSIETLTGLFRELRSSFVRRLDDLDEETALTASLHPRLEQPMRILDLAYFVAEHDDHHLATMHRARRSLLR